MKYEWRKKDKEIYLPKTEPTVIDLEPTLFLTIEGEGNPNSEVFQQSVEALYALSYGLKMAPKKGIIIDGYYDYTVFPLEGEWNLSEEGIKAYKAGKPIIELKDFFTFKIMIRQPEFITSELFEPIRETTFKKKKNDLINKVKLEVVEEGLNCQMMHIGSYDSEPASFQKMEEYCKENNYQRLSKQHKEIYLSDPRKVSEDKMKTTLRFKIKRENS